jgi:outer membrane protein assembly factor BamB
VFERDERTWAVFGAYDHDVHFLDADTGEQILAPYPTNDIIKGSVTVDPDGYPIVYSGSRDDFFHVIAIDRDEPVALWRLDGNDIEGGLWNNDWDGSALVLDDYLFQGGENSIFYVVKLNRGYDDAGLVTVDPEVVFTAPGYDQDLLAAVGQNVSIENSVAVSGNVVYFANSGGLVQGWRVGGLDQGREPKRVFRYWVGDDVDASIVVDDEGFLYVGVEYERGNSRSLEVGQLVKLNPRKKNDPLVWSVFDNASLPAGIWATPALHEDLVIAPTDSGRVLGVDRSTGEIRWELRLPGPLWSSPVVVDDVLLQGDCNGVLHAYDVSDTTVEPPQLWTLSLTGCIESTPAVWDGRIIFGTRAGQVHMLAD